MSDYYNPVKIVQTDNWQFELNKNSKELNISSPIVITTPGNKNRLHLNSIFKAESIFSDFGSNPNFEDCNNAIKFCQYKLFDGVIAIGGGSAMDLAKVIMAHLCLGKTDIFELIEYKKKYPNSIPSIFLPTTHGTASEVTMWGTVWNMDENKKYSVSHKSLYPNVAILDGHLTLSLPMDISIMTTMDALSHSFESIWNKNSNPTSTDHAISAICSILKNAPILKSDPQNLDVRKNLLEASTVAGLAFSNTTTAAAHSISYPLTIRYGIPHGVASSLSLIPLLDINGPFIKDPIDRICKNNDLTFIELKKSIKEISSGIVPYTLDKWGISIENLETLANESFTKGRMDNNIVDLSKFDVFNILNEVFD